MNFYRILSQLSRTGGRGRLNGYFNYMSSSSSSRAFAPAAVAVCGLSKSLSTISNKAPVILYGQGHGQTQILGNRRNFSPQAEPLTKDLIEGRVMHVLKLYDKIDPSKLTLESHFMNDLGLDSLDHVEVIMSIEDEFGFEIPDSDAEKLLKPKDLIQYIADKKEVTQ